MYVCIYIDVKQNFVICEHIKAIKDSFSSCFYYYYLHTYEVMYMEGLQLDNKFSYWCHQGGLFKCYLK